METERRTTSRRRVLRRGRIVFPGGHSTVDCVVLDLSPTGARLKLTQLLGIPDRFDLRLENGPDYRAEVRYRTLDTTGVSFVADPA